MTSYQENDYKPLYKSMKRKLKILIYENECFQEELKKAQKSLLKVQRDKTFLLDRILQYQQGPESSSDSEQTDDSDNENYNKDNKRKKVGLDQSSSFNVNSQGNNKSSNVKKKKSSQNVLGSGVVLSKNVIASRHSHGAKQVNNNAQTSPFSKGGTSSSPSPAHHKLKGGSLQASLAASQNRRVAVSAHSATSSATSDGQMTREEIERQLAARQPISDFSTAVSLTLPNQLFSDNITEGDLMDNDLETSPSNLGEDITFENFD